MYQSRKKRPSVLLIVLAILFLGAAVFACVKLFGSVMGNGSPTSTPTITVSPLTPTDTPTNDSTESPDIDPTDNPTDQPTVDITESPSVEPTIDPTDGPTDQPTVTPTTVSTGTNQPEKKYVALTFDDGPSIYTKRVLDALADADAVATFFVVGERVNEYSSTIQRIYDEGHELANHTYDHKSLTRISLEAAREEIKKTSDLVEAVCGFRPVVVRPPYGEINKERAEALGIRMILWTVDTLDWKTRNTDSIVKEVKNGMGTRSIILMHDLYETTAAAAEIVIPWLQEQGYTFVTVSELIGIREAMGVEVGMIYPSW